MASAFPGRPHSELSHHLVFTSSSSKLTIVCAAVSKRKRHGTARGGEQQLTPPRARQDTTGERSYLNCWTTSESTTLQRNGTAGCSRTGQFGEGRPQGLARPEEVGKKIVASTCCTVHG